MKHPNAFALSLGIMGWALGTHNPWAFSFGSMVMIPSALGKIVGLALDCVVALVVVLVWALWGVWML